MENEEVLQETENLVGDTDTEIEVNDLEVEDIEVLKGRLQKAEEISRNQKIRAEKAERALKQKTAQPEVKEVTPKLTSNSVSLKEKILEGKALSAMHEDDVEEVADYAERHNIPLYESLKIPFIKSYLDTRSEERKTAQATNTSGSRRGTQNVSAEQIVSAGLGGKEVDPVKFAEAQMELRKQKKS